MQFVTPSNFNKFNSTLGNGAAYYWESFPGNLLPNGFSLTRASGGTYFDSAGLLQTASTDVTRGTYRYNGSAWVFDGTMIEAAATNICTYSEDYTDASWQKYLAQVVVTANQYTAPDGNATMDKLQCTASGASLYLMFKTYARTAAQYVHTEYIRYVNHRWISITFLDASLGTVKGAGFDLLNGVVGTTSAGLTATITPVGNNTYRCEITSNFFNGVDASDQIRIALNNIDAVDAVSWSPVGTEAIGIWGAMEELGSSATSYIATGAASAPRAADVPTAPTAGLLVNGQGFAAIGARIIAASGAGPWVVFGSNGVGGLPLYFPTTTSPPQLAMYDVTNIITYGTSTNMPSVGVSFKAATTWGGVTSGGALNGVVGTPLTAFDGSLNLDTTLRIGDGFGSGFPISMVLQSMRLGQSAASSGQLATYTS